MPKLDRESAEEWLAESVRRLHVSGWLVTGSIELIDYSVCPTCGKDTIWDGTEHLCPVCCVAVRYLRPTRPNYEKLARDYLTKLILVKGLEPLPDLMGLCTQVDSMLVSVPPKPAPKPASVAGKKPNGDLSTKILKESLGIADDAPICSNCGGLMTRSGTCYKCMGCGSTSGCS